VIVEIYLKNNPHPLQIDVTSMKIKRNGLGDFVGLTWEDEPGPGKRHLEQVTLSEIAAIVSTTPYDPAELPTTGVKADGRCAWRSESGWRCRLDARHTDMHAPDLDEQPDLEQYRAATGEDWTP
jgi:hypothetical protein